MREIKFRIWDKDRERMQKAGIDEYAIASGYRTYVVLGFNGTISEFEKDRIGGQEEVTERYELMQFTGLLDKNGKEIYEGDIVRDKREGFLFVVEWEELIVDEYLTTCGWCMRKVKGNWAGIADYDGLHNDGELEIIGNIYENKDLLA